MITIYELILLHPLSAEPFFRLLDFSVLEKVSAVRSLLSMRGMLLGYSLKPRLNIRALATARYDRRFRSVTNTRTRKARLTRTRLASPEAWAAMTPKVCRT